MRKLLLAAACLAALSTSAHADTLWDLNGSLIHMTSDVNINMVYDRVRPGLVETISTGALSFTGRAIGNRLVGDAFVYTKFCPGMAFPYYVDGVNRGDVIELRGAAPIIDPNICAVISYSYNSRNSHRVYKLLSNPRVVIKSSAVPTIVVAPRIEVNPTIVVNPAVEPYDTLDPPPVAVPAPRNGSQRVPPMGQNAQREDLLRQGKEFCRRYPSDKVCGGRK